MPILLALAAPAVAQSNLGQTGSLPPPRPPGGAAPAIVPNPPAPAKPAPPVAAKPAKPAVPPVAAKPATPTAGQPVTPASAGKPATTTSAGKPATTTSAGKPATPTTAGKAATTTTAGKPTPPQAGAVAKPPKPAGAVPEVQPKPGPIAQPKPATPAQARKAAPAAAPAAGAVAGAGSAPAASKPAEPAAPPIARVGSATNLPLPRFAALGSNQVNLRIGPDLRYRIDWTYQRRDLPVQIVDEHQHWRRIRDPEGTEGWVQRPLLASRRTFLVQGEERALRRRAEENADPVALLKPGVVGQIRSCAAGSTWCAVRVGEYRGFIRRDEVWGVGAQETIAD